MTKLEFLHMMNDFPECKEFFENKLGGNFDEYDETLKIMMNEAEKGIFHIQDSNMQVFNTSFTFRECKSERGRTLEHFDESL